MDIVNEFFQFYKLWSKFGRNHKSVQVRQVLCKRPWGPPRVWKYQWTDDLLFVLLRFSCFAYAELVTYLFTCLGESEPVKQEVSHTVIRSK